MALLLNTHRTQNSLKIIQIALIAFLSIVLFIITAANTASAGKNDKAVKRWATQLQKSRDVRERVDAAKYLGYHSTEVSLAALASALASDPSEKVRQRAASSLWKLSPKIDPARKALQKSLKDPFPGVRVRSSWALQRAGVKPEELAAPRRSALTDPKSTVSTKYWAARGLIGIAEPILLIGHLLEYTKPSHRSENAEYALKRLIKQNDRKIIDPMKSMVRTYHKGNATVLESLHQFKPLPDDLVSLLCLQFDYNDIELDRRAIALFRQHASNEEDVRMWLPKIKPYLQDKDDTARSFAISAVSRAGGLAVEAVPELVMLMQKSKDQRARGNSARAVGDIGDRIKPYPDLLKQSVSDQAVPTLIRMISNEKDSSNQTAAIRALDKLKTDPEQVIPVFITAAKTGTDVRVRTAALSAIGARGADSASVLDDVKELTKDSARPVRTAAESAVTMIERNYNRASETLKPAKGVSQNDQKTAMADLRSTNTSFDERGFMLALSENEVDKVKAFLDSGISPNFKFKSSHDQPALNLVFSRASIYLMSGKPTPKKLKDTVRLLLDRGADPNLTDKMGNTALISASMACDAETLQILLDSGADLNLRTSAGLSALEFAFVCPNPGAEALLKAGARIRQDEVAGYLKAYGKKPEAAALIKKAAQP